MARSPGDGTVRKRSRADGTPFYEARIRIHGQQVSFYDDTRTGALAAARAARADADRGRSSAPQKGTVGRYLEEWLEASRSQVRARTWRGYEMYCRVWIVPALGRVRLEALTPGQVTTMLARVVASGRSPTTAHHIRAVLSVALSAAMRDHGLARNVAKLAKEPRSDRPKFQSPVVTAADADRILSAFEGHRYWPLVAFSIATGVRQGELLALRWADVDEKARTVTISRGVDVRGGKRVLARPKTEKAHRTLPLPELALRALATRRKHEAEDRLLAGGQWEDHGLIFAGPLGRIRENTAVTHTFQKHLARSGLPALRWHDLRHVYAALLLDQGVSLHAIRDALGHSEIRTTEGYAYTMPDALEAVRAAINGQLGTG